MLADQEPRLGNYLAWVNHFGFQEEDLGLLRHRVWCKGFGGLVTIRRPAWGVLAWRRQSRSGSGLGLGPVGNCR